MGRLTFQQWLWINDHANIVLAWFGLMMFLDINIGDDGPKVTGFKFVQRKKNLRKFLRNKPPWD